MLKTEPQLNTLSGHVRRFRKFSDWAILLASKTRFLRKISGFFFRFCVILPLEPYRTVSK